MNEVQDKIPFWKERYLALQEDIGDENILMGLMLGGLVTLMYWKHCKRCKR